MKGARAWDPASTTQIAAAPQSLLGDVTDDGALGPEMATSASSAIRGISSPSGTSLATRCC